MWLYTTDGFYSVVEHYDDPTKLVVRGRCPDDLGRLKQRLGTKASEIIKTPHSDYRYRFMVSRDDFASVVSELVTEIDYDNFKDRACAHYSRKLGWDNISTARSRAYFECWRAMHRFQDNIHPES